MIPSPLNKKSLPTMAPSRHPFYLPSTSTNGPLIHLRGLKTTHPPSQMILPKKKKTQSPKKKLPRNLNRLLKTNPLSQKNQRYEKNPT